METWEAVVRSLAADIIFAALVVWDTGPAAAVVKTGETLEEEEANQSSSISFGGTHIGGLFHNVVNWRRSFC